MKCITAFNIQSKSSLLFTVAGPSSQEPSRKHRTGARIYAGHPTAGMTKTNPISMVEESENEGPSALSSSIHESLAADEDDDEPSPLLLGPALKIRSSPKCFTPSSGCIATLVVVLLLVVFMGGANSRWSLDRNGSSKPSLQFSRASNETWKFKILQIADIHLGEAEDTDWGSEQDRKTWVVLNKLISQEAPDLIVLSGDQVTANNCDGNATEYYRLLGQFLSTYGIPWATIFGNHDDMDFEIPGTNLTKPAKYSREDLLEVDQSFALSRTQEGPSNVFGTSNYVLDISMHDRPAARVYLLDSGGGALPKEIQQNQVEWLTKQFSFSPQLPAVAFQHIPSKDFFFDDTLCQGLDGDGGFEPVDYDAGIARTLSHSGHVHFLGVGHNHGNDYCCPYSDTKMHVCFGRHSGYGGYGSWERGGRVYELTIHEEDQHALHWKSWVRLESGTIEDEISYS